MFKYNRQASNKAWAMMWSIYEIIHIWTAVIDESEEWSSQLIFPENSVKASISKGLTDNMHFLTFEEASDKRG